MYLYADERDSGTYWRIRESYYDDGNVKTRNVLYLGTVETIHERFSQPIPDDVELTSISFGPEAALRWAFEDLGLDSLFTDLLNPQGTHEFPAWKKLFVLVWRRFFKRSSIREAIQSYDDEVFPFWWREDIPTEQRFYQFLADSLDERTIDAAQQHLAEALLADANAELCHLDTTDYTTYAEDDTEFLRLGKSKDNVVGRRLVGLALALDEQGTPILGDAYPGNKHDSKVFPNLFRGVCNRLEHAGADSENMTVVFDRGFDDKENFNLAAPSDPFIVAAVKRNRSTVSELLEDIDVEEFGQAYKTSYGTCFVTKADDIQIGEYTWHTVLSYHDTTREKIQSELDAKRTEVDALLDRQVERLEGGKRGRPPTANSIRRKLKDVLGGDFHRIDWTFDEETKDLHWEWTEAWDWKYQVAGIQPLITDHEDWTPGRIAKTYFERNDIEEMFHLTKEALIVPVEPPYVKEDALIRAHLFLVFVGLVCYQHVKRQFPDSMTDQQIKDGLQRIKLVVAAKDETIQFKLANLDYLTEQLVVGLNLRDYIPK